TPILAREIFRERKQRATVAAALSISPDRHPSKCSRRPGNVDSNDTHRLASVKKEVRKVAVGRLIRMILVVNTNQAPVFEQHLTPNFVISLPGFGVHRRNKFVIVSSFYH